MLTVAIATEYDGYDAEVYRTLLERLLGETVGRYATHRRFSGWKSIGHLADAYLRGAEQTGVSHALFAIDNDGGARRAAAHDRAHHAPTEAANEDGCRVCWLAEALPAWWTADQRKHCLVVPIQTLETWLLCLRGDAFNAPSPEQEYDRRALKKRFFGRPEPPAAERLRLALAQVTKPDALDILRQRPSFQHFEEQLAGWR